MATIVLTTQIRGSLEKCFDAARDLDLHLTSMAKSGERAVAGRTSGLIEYGEQVTWEAKHFGVRQQFTSKITGYSRPVYFQDSMVRGAFKSFVHDHYFEHDSGITTMRDVLTFQSPLGIIGKLVDKMIMSRYLFNLLESRNQSIKVAVEHAP
jgi:ligand-binding SRPBCC domain-containing protein